jgi:hypothetical protein
MIQIEKLNAYIQMNVVINPDLDKYDDIDLFKEKNERAFAFIKEHPLPEEWVKKIKDGRIKRYFEQNMSIEEIAQRVSLPKEAVLMSLEEMSLIQPVVA